MTNKERQLYILRNEPQLYACYLQYRYVMNRIQYSEPNEQELIVLNERASILAETLSGYDYQDVLQCARILKNKNKRVKRLHNDINAMLEHQENARFITITFSNMCIEKTSPQTRRTYVSRFLKAVGVKYNANIDFGEEKGREHYHGCVLFDQNLKEEDCANLQDQWRKMSYNSNLDLKYIHHPKTSRALANYIAKLSLHAFKETAKGNRIIYSRES